MSTTDNTTSGARTTIYAFGAAVIAAGGYYVQAEVDEIALWTALLVAGIPFGSLVMATVKTWPKRKGTEPDA